MLNYWADIGIPKEMDLALRIVISIEQIRLYQLLEKDPAKIFDKLKQYAIEKSASVSQKVLIYFSLMLNLANENVSVYFSYLDYILNHLNDLDNRAEDLNNPEMFTALLWVPIQKINSFKEVESWLMFISKVEDIFNIDFFAAGIAKDAITVLSNRIVSFQNSTEKENQERIKEQLKILSDFFEKRNNEILAAIIYKKILFLEFQVLKQISQAEELALSLMNRFSSPTAQYLISDTIGRLYYDTKDMSSAQKWLQVALELDCNSGSEFIETLLYGAAISSEENSEKAVELLRKALKLMENQKIFTELDYIQILGELAIAYWINHEFVESFSCFERVVNKLFEIKSTQFGIQWIRLFSWVAHSLGYISASVARDKVPELLSDGSNYTKPYQGILSFNTKDLSDHYNEKYTSLVMVHLAIFADGFNNIKKTYEWTTRAFDLARKIGDQQVLLMISSVCAQYFVINFKTEEALEADLLFSAISGHLKGTPEEKTTKYANINLDELFSCKPSAEWNRAEELTVEIAITPLFIILLTAHLENNSNKDQMTKEFIYMLQNYIPQASDTFIWEEVLNITNLVIRKETTLKELSDRANNFRDQDKKYLQILCILGCIYVTKDSEKALFQIINIFPYLMKLYNHTKSIVKFALVPFVKTKGVQILQKTYVGNKKELELMIDVIKKIDVREKNAVQLILQPIAKENSLKLPEDRKLWLYDFEEI